MRYFDGILLTIAGLFNFSLCIWSMLSGNFAWYFILAYPFAIFFSLAYIAAGYIRLTKQGAR